MAFKTHVKNIIHFVTVNSTMDEALSFVKEGLENPFLIIAEEQKIGKGRGKNTWSSPKGGFYGTYALPLEIQLSTKQILFMHYATALAVQQTIEKLAEINCQIKWPNDIHIQDRKLGGILIEYISSKRLFLLIGIGINLNTRIEDIDPDYMDKSTSLLFETNQTFEVNEFISILSEKLLKISSEIILNNFSHTVEYYNNKLIFYNRIVKLESGRTLVCKGINENGMLHLEDENEKIQLTIEDSKMILGMI